jgi:hypothetical protein
LAKITWTMYRNTFGLPFVSAFQSFSTIPELLHTHWYKLIVYFSPPLIFFHSITHDDCQQKLEQLYNVVVPIWVKKNALAMQHKD